MIDNIEHCAPLGNSDHEVLEFNFLYKNVNDVNSYDRLRYFKGDYEVINEVLANVDWELLLATGSIDDLWDRFTDKISIAYSKENIPVCKSKPKHYDTPWMNKDTLSAVQNKRKMWKKYKYCRSPYNKERYDHAKTVSSMKVREAQAPYEKSVALKAKEDPKVFWRYVQSKTKVKESIQCIVDENGEVHTDNGTKAGLLNNFFQSVFMKEPDCEILATFNSRTDLRLENVMFDEATVNKYLSKVKKSKSQGSDSIHPKLIKETVVSIFKPATKIFNKSMEEKKLPKIWKIANITPKHKKVTNLMFQTIDQ
jgi:hypothetical protein